MLIIGESINGTVPKVGQAIVARDAAFITQLARQQVEAGAQMLDVNAGVAGGKEMEDLPWLVQTVQAAVDLPVMLDCASPEGLQAALAVHRGRPIINSISGESKRLEKVLPLVVQHSCGTVILCLNEKGIPSTPQARFELAQAVVQRATQAGVQPQDIYVDPLVLAIGAEWQAAKVSLAAMRLIRERLPEVHIICGLSNASFGMPNRSLLNSAFLAMAIAQGLDTFFLDVRDRRVMANLWAANVLAGNDPRCSAYLKAYRAGKLKG